jgi:hypothetical protein
MGSPQEVGSRSAGIVRIARVCDHQRMICFPFSALDLAQDSTQAETSSQLIVPNEFSRTDCCTSDYNRLNIMDVALILLVVVGYPTAYSLRTPDQLHKPQQGCSPKLTPILLANRKIMIYSYDAESSTQTDNILHALIGATTVRSTDVAHAYLRPLLPYRDPV